MSTKHNHPWQFPKCPNCETDVLVENIPKDKANEYICLQCDTEFNENGGTNEYNYTFRQDHKNLLSFLQDYRNYFTSTHLVDDYNVTTERASKLFAALAERDYIEKWGSRVSPWTLTEKGENWSEQC